MGDGDGNGNGDNNGDGGGVRQDAALTLVVFVPIAVAAVALSAPRSPTLFGAGVVGAVALELLVSLRAAQVRALWADHRVQALAVLITVGGGVVLAFVAGAWVLTVILGGLCGYLVILALVVLNRRRRPRENG